MEALEEMLQFLDLNARLDLKIIALQYILGLSGSVEGVQLISSCKKALCALVNLLNDKNEACRKDSMLCLVNISAESEAAISLLRVETYNGEGDKQNIVDILIPMLLDPENKNADPVCMILCNVSRPEESLPQCATSILPHLPRLLDAFTDVSYNKAGCKLHYLGPLLSNVSGNIDVRDWFCSPVLGQPPLARVASFCSFQESVVRRGGAVGTIRNICFDVDRHNWLLSSEVDLLPCLLLPLAGGEEYADDEMDSLPISLQYLPQEKQRERDPDIRKLLLESLSRLCAKKDGREFLRQHGTYCILRELHKWEQDRQVLLACENVVDILIRKEEEMQAEDILSVEVPEEYHEKFKKQDDAFINDE